MEHLKKSPSSSSSRPSFPRDPRGSLEVFNPTSNSTSPVRSPSSWTETEEQRNDSIYADEVTISNTSWMAIKEGETGAAAQRAAEWGLVLKTDAETGKPQGVAVRNSGDDEQNGKHAGKRNSNNSGRVSGDSSDGGDPRGFPRVSEDLKDALSAFQQTFVVSDATKPDYPIMYASAGFFKMTGYTSKEVIGRNCRFLQGADTDPEDVARIREALEGGKSYCGRLLNYKKDGTPFWNLLTISPIKDDDGNVLKLIGMLVEVNKHTEGSKEKNLRPNGLPESLIRYDGMVVLDGSSSISV